MSANLLLQGALRRLVDSFVFRRIADAVFRARCRREVARLDRLDTARAQRRILLSLVHAAQATPFGREHDFRRIRTEADFRRLVPLRTPGELVRARAPSLPTGARTAAGRGWATALALAAGAWPRRRLLSGRLVFLHDAAANVNALPMSARPYALAVEGDALTLLAQPGMTVLAGPPHRLAPALEEARGLAGGKRAIDLWPDLTVLLYNRRSPADAAPRRVFDLVGPDVPLLATCFLPQGPAAVEDPRRGGLRLLCDHGAYFEFVPAAQAGRPDATRHGAAEVEPGVDYELVMTSAAGAWACRTGMAVRFERRDPPVFRLAELPAPARQVFTRPTCPAPAPHRQTAGTPAGPSETPAHTLWSAPADRG